VNIIRKNYEYLEDIDVLVRVYKNQAEEADEMEQIACEMLFKDHVGKQHERCTSWLPRGAVKFVVEELNALEDRDLKIQISNELESVVGVLTSVSYAFDNSMEWDALKE
jgi:hypothetical protein